MDVVWGFEIIMLQKETQQELNTSLSWAAVRDLESSWQAAQIFFSGVGIKHIFELLDDDTCRVLSMR